MSVTSGSSSHAASGLSESLRSSLSSACAFMRSPSCLKLRNQHLSRQANRGREATLAASSVTDEKRLLLPRVPQVSLDHDTRKRLRCLPRLDPNDAESDLNGRGRFDLHTLGGKCLLQGQPVGCAAAGALRQVLEDLDLNRLPLEGKSLIVVVPEVGVAREAPVDSHREETIQAARLQVHVGRVRQEPFTCPQTRHLAEVRAGIYLHALGGRNRGGHEQRKRNRCRARYRAERIELWPAINGAHSSCDRWSSRKARSGCRPKD